MFTLPQLVEEDIAAFDAILADFIARSGSRAALLIDHGGFIITRSGDLAGFDTASLGALAANSFAATQAIAGLISETMVKSLYQEGGQSSLLIQCVDEYGLLVVIFPAETGVGSIRFFTMEAVPRLSDGFARARNRSPDSGLDLSDLNIADASPLFRRIQH